MLKTITLSMFATILGLSPISTLADSKSMTCGELAQANRTYSDNYGKAAVDSLMLILQDEYILESAKKSAWETYEKNKTGDEKNAYFHSLEMFSKTMDTKPKVNNAIVKKGGLNAMVTSICNKVGDEKFPIYEIYNTMIAIEMAKAVTR